MDAAKPNRPASNEVVVDREPTLPKADTAALALGQMIAEALAEFDPEFPSERRLKVNPARPPIALPRTWAKKAG